MSIREDFSAKLDKYPGVYAFRTEYPLCYKNSSFIPSSITKQMITEKAHRMLDEVGDTLKECLFQELTSSSSDAPFRDISEKQEVFRKTEESLQILVDSYKRLTEEFGKTSMLSILMPIQNPRIYEILRKDKKELMEKWYEIAKQADHYERHCRVESMNMTSYDYDLSQYTHRPCRDMKAVQEYLCPKFLSIIVCKQEAERLKDSVMIKKEIKVKGRKKHLSEISVFSLPLFERYHDMVLRKCTDILVDSANYVYKSVREESGLFSLPYSVVFLCETVKSYEHCISVCQEARDIDLDACGGGDIMSNSFQCLALYLKQQLRCKEYEEKAEEIMKTVFLGSCEGYRDEEPCIEVIREEIKSPEFSTIAPFWFVTRTHIIKEMVDSIKAHSLNDKKELQKDKL